MMLTAIALLLGIIVGVIGRSVFAEVEVLTVIRDFATNPAAIILPGIAALGTILIAGSGLILLGPGNTNPVAPAQRRMLLGFWVGAFLLMSGQVFGAFADLPRQDHTVDDASLLYDIGMNDDAVVTPGQIFDKGWRLYNKGDTNWLDYEIRRFIRTDALPKGAGPSGQRIQTVDAKTDSDIYLRGIVAPSQPGCYRTEYKLYSSRTQSQFGELLWLQYVVDPSGVSPVQDYGVFVNDLNIRSGTKIPHDSTFTKEWQLHNCGDNDWVNYQVRRVEGSIGPAQLTLPTVSAHQDVDLRIPMVAPPVQGPQKATYIIESPTGKTIIDGLLSSLAR